MNKLVIAALLAVSSFGAHAVAINGLVSTGAGLAAGTQDTNYSLSVAAGSTVLPGNYGYVTANNVWPISPWIQNDAASSWLTPFQSQGTSFDPVQNGVYNWHLSFDLTGYDLNTASFAGRFAADNAATILLNGQAIASSSSFSSWTNFAANTGFVAGVNSLDFVVTNYHQNGGNPTGLRVEFTDSNVAAVPEPETYALMALGLVGVAVARRRRTA